MSPQFIQSLFSTVPLKSIWGLVWPQTVMMLCTMVIGLTDIWTAGRIHADIQAAIGLSSQLQAFLMVLGIALGSGAMAAVSQSLGAGRRTRGQRYTGLVISVAVCLALMLALIGYAARNDILALLQVPVTLRPLTAYFFTLVLLALPAQYVMGVGSTLFRAARNVIMPLVVVMVATVINIVGDLGFGLGCFGFPRMGVAGIAWSTVVAVYASGALTLLFLRRCRLFVPGVVPPPRWMRRAAPYLLKVALPAVLTSFLWHSGYLLLFVIMGSLPENSVTALAGMTAGMRVESILFMPAMAFNVTASILVGNALGAGDKAAARRIGLATAGTGVALMSAVGLGMWPWMPELAAAFSPDMGVQAQIVAYLTYNILSTPFTVGSMILNGVMTGAGATMYTLVVNTSCIWLVRLPLGWFLAHQVWGEARGVYAAMLVSMTVQACTMLWVFFHRDWARHAMRAAVLHHPPASHTEVSREHA
ncbi:MAG: MATE family efflux transporter [Desulfovibrionaceae bacterium]|nr:MATE family efflux transporter [Desulfovibrionaceae bacterium]